MSIYLCAAAIQSRIEAVTGIKAAPVNPPEKLSGQWPFSVALPLNGAVGGSQITGIIDNYTLIIQLHYSRKNLPESYEQVMKYYEPMTRAIVSNPVLTYDRHIVSVGFFGENSSLWTKGTGWTISGGKANCSGAQTTTSNLVQPQQYQQYGGLQIGTSYITQFNVTNRTAGNVRISVGSSGTGTWRNENDLHDESIVCAGNTTLYITADADFDGSVDDIYVYESNSVVGNIIGPIDWTFGESRYANIETLAFELSIPIKLHRS